ncbi:hypothetical protein BDV26DRAFT_278635 [Aspergillus bertholletiae]|uniref:Zn(2)-C6 fungal-type domain-containing protein n=1 Tax=Aspergillus bertholletiae TaxID=1226010 RepID=A0A5N7BIS8_9EURO|nr:hypothetical protein BDV26DRAFT_278635 [Aspergillus bertholletiae]
MPPVSSAHKGIRASIACKPCRYKHLRCDGQKPACSRCVADRKQCIYPESRRGGARGQPPVRKGLSDTTNSSDIDASSVSQRSNTLSTPVNPDDINAAHATFDQVLLGLYYKFFHAAHPCVLPCHFLKQRLNDERIQPLLLAMQYIGSLFAVSISSVHHEKRFEEALTSIRLRERPVTGYDVQAILLYAIAVYWCNEPERGTELIDEAIQTAVEIGLNQSTFATEYGQNDPVLEESWRRSWWQIYTTDAHIAGSTHTFPFKTSGIEMDVGLPCEEWEYESGNIPQHHTLEEYNDREFMPYDIEFSSFAELIGLTRGIDLALPSSAPSSIQQYISICTHSDTATTAWYSLLPQSKKTLIHSDGSLDEVMFKAHFVMHTYTVELHRPLSNLSYSSIEQVSRCAPRPPSSDLRECNATESRLHTAKCLQAIEKLDWLLTLPTNITTHSPFIICMIANVTIAHLSACRFVYEEEKLRIAREKIRLTMGTLKVLSQYWTLGKRTYSEIGIIAREILSLTHTGPKVTAQPCQPEQEAINLALLDMLPNGDFDFCTMFDSIPPQNLEMIPI